MRQDIDNARNKLWLKVLEHAEKTGINMNRREQAINQKLIEHPSLSNSLKLMALTVNLFHSEGITKITQADIGYRCNVSYTMFSKQFHILEHLCILRRVREGHVTGRPYHYEFYETKYWKN